MPARRSRGFRPPRTRRELLVGLLALGAWPGCRSGRTTRPAPAARDDVGIGHLNAHAAAYARDRSVTFVFGGASESEVRADLWEQSIGGWRLVARRGPSPRTFPAMAFDDRRRRLVLFGGNRVLFGTGGDTLLGDTWEWDGAAWWRAAAVGPPARSEATATFDQTRGTVLVFGGWRYDGGERVRLGDLWEWDGSRWSELAVAGPTARSGAAMAFDPVVGRTLLVGGNGGRRDVWSWAEAEWRRLSDMPIGRTNPAIAHDRRMGVMVVFGGWDGRQRVSATSLFDGRRWRPHARGEPSPRNHSTLVESAAARGLLLLGGHTGGEVLGDVWRWRSGWRQIVHAEPRERIRNGH